MIMNLNFIATMAIMAMTTTLNINAATKANETKANDSSVRYIGRVAQTPSGSVSYDWVGTYLSVRFTGKQIAVKASDEGKSYHNVFIDGVFKKKILITGKNQNLIVLASGLKSGTHVLKLQKCTEGEFGCTTIHGFVLDRGGKLLPAEPKKRLVEFYGDSYTCGYGTESQSKDEHFTLETENCNKAYGCIIARYFDADYRLVAHSGQGIVRNYGYEKQASPINMSVRSTRLFDDHDSVAYDYKCRRPDLVVVNLGTNDFSPVAVPTPQQYSDAYCALIKSIRSHYGEVPVLCVLPFSANEYLQCAFNFMKPKAEALGNVHFADTRSASVTHDKDMGADWHPNYSGQRKIAMVVIPQIASIMGWPLENKAVE